MDDYEINTPIRIAHIMGKLWAGGVESVVFNYYREINRQKFQFDFFYDADSTIEPPSELIDMGARFFEIPPYQDLKNYLRTLEEYFLSNKYTIVHSHINTLSFFPLYIAKKVGIPVRIIHNHSVPGGKEYGRNLLKYVFKNFSKTFSTDYFACSEKAARWMFGNKCYNAGKVFVMKNAIDYERFSNVSSNAVAKVTKQYNLDGKFVVGHVGRFTYAKNHMFLLEIFKEIKKIKNNSILLLVGDGELREQIEKKIVDEEIIDSVTLVGKSTETELYYKVMNVIVFPSVFEGLSMTTIEAQMSGVPIVISDAVPIEAIISSKGVKRNNLNDPIEKWVADALSVSEEQVCLASASKEYMISNAVLLLEKKYMEIIGAN